ncbi:hypothetical protein SEA_PARADIDDLES_129 [Streptomyces phage Paradiddles]|uniref:Uncharacterized protein n=3 Tax=Samistivirus TaxID=2560220 RepID=A0A514U1Z6_9CAUD|nr:hypothetical protein FDI36_gp135 [Streptomyces phage NootNoot]YP_009611113.1 hypothetical protein FDI37_gp132 [Streptomyces phage Paradiddles]YP_010104016.1 hypothetical protein KNU71_gp140 [Streptomyces phage Braelyn]UGL63122.1 membrane protein [Streptomyces phage Bartholomune]UOW93554.1 membrane protein [Streptomyces phage Squillium]WNM73004.1 membrane protein [Streptomyces phage Persimmon]WNM73386.1 hypothetical protein SEA_LIANDRY_133 [Streptomyces phage Liandry]WNM74784.1 hypothetica
MPPKIPTQIEARIVVGILCGIIGCLFASFIMVGCISESNETSKMKACVSKQMEWVNAPGGPECRKPLDRLPQPSYSSSTEKQ